MTGSCRRVSRAQPSSVFVVALFLPLAVAALRHNHDAAQCLELPFMNLTAPDIASSKYFFSAQDCCDYCATTDGCVGANYADYLCSPKGSLEKENATIGRALLSDMGPTLAPRTATPTTARPTETPPSTETPSTETPETPAPTSHHSPKLLIFTKCTYSAACNRSADSTCYTLGFEFDRCYPASEGAEQSYVYTLDSASRVVQHTFPSTNCVGGAQLSIPELGVCTSDDGGYYEFALRDYPTPAANCPNLLRVGCYQGSCEYDLFPNGGCELTSTFHSSDGASTRVVKGADNSVWWRAYSSADCTGNASASFVDPFDEEYYSSNEYLRWNCTAVVADTPAPRGVVQLVVTTQCTTSSNCSVVNDGSCVSRAVVSGDCELVTTDGGASYTQTRTCDRGVIAERVYGTKTCSGDTHDSLIPLGNCTALTSSGYIETNCIDMPSNSGQFVTLQRCDTTSTPVACTNSVYVSGQCMATSGQGVNHNGNTILVYCSADYAWWRTFNSWDCTGVPLQSHVDRLNLKWMSESVSILWTCGAPPATTAAPAHSIALARRTQCSSSPTCNVRNDTSCVTLVYPADGTCVERGDGGSLTYLCYPNEVIRRYFDNGDCRGDLYFEHSNSLSTCETDHDGDAYELFDCGTLSLAVKGNPSYPITRERCTEGSSSDSGVCTNTSYIPGVCNNGAIAYCGGSYVWVQNFQDGSCTDAASSQGFDVGVKLPAFSEAAYDLWTCSVP